MASRARTPRQKGKGKRSEVADESESYAATPDISSATAESLLSPTRASRIQEKQQLQHLNDRLAQYIDRVRNLESENQRLTVQIRSSEEVVVRERNNIRAAFEAELADARRLLDETAKEKARVQIDADKAKAEFDDLKARIAKLERDFKDSETKRLHSDSMVQDLQAKLNTADNQRKHWEDDAKKLRSESDALKKQLETARRQLEEETLLRVDLENRLQSMREELAFNKQLYEQELEETRRKRQTEISEIGRDLEDKYQEQLQEKLNEMRAQLDDQLRSNRKEIADMYQKKMGDLADSTEKHREAAANAREELKTMRFKLDTMEKEKNRYESQVAGLERKIKDMEDQLKNAREDYHTKLAGQEDEIHRLREEIGRMMSEYQDLMDTKIQLDVEIEAYRRLLEGEETRLHLSPTPPGSVQPTPARGSPQRGGVKRKRVLQEEQKDTFESYDTTAGHEGDIEIMDHDIEGNYVKIRNSGDKDQSVGSFVVKRTGGGKEVTYKFHGKQMIKAGKTMTLWGNASGRAAKAPTDFLLKNTDLWPRGEHIRSILLDTDGEEVAWRESNRRSSSHRFSFHSGLAPASVESNGMGDADQRCSIM